MSKPSPQSVRDVTLPQAQSQLDLLAVPPADFVAKLEAKGDYTGERLKTQRPELYQRVIALLAQGHGSQYIQDQTGVSKNTVKAVRKNEGETIDIVKARLAENSFDLADQAQEASAIVINEIMSSQARRAVLTMKDAQALQAIASNAVTNGQLLTGKPTSNISVEVFAQPSEDLNAAIAAHIAGLKSAATHSAAEKNAAPVLQGAHHGADQDADASAGQSAHRSALAAPAVLEIESRTPGQPDGQSDVGHP